MGLTDGLSSLNNNLVNFVRILDHLTDSKVKLIYASSSGVYGKSGSWMRTENDTGEINIGNFYDLTKREMDLYAPLFNVESYGLRFGTVNGWSPHLRVDIMLNSMNEAVRRGGRIRASNLSVYRPILGIDDLCRAVLKIIDSREDKRGIYNLASMNNTVEEIARTAAEFLDAEVDYIPGLDESVYSFSISSDKFMKAFDFQFEETIPSILKSLEKQQPTIKTNRNEPVKYRV
jgi:nucleoside-diphosphate-sugar epimerase